MSDAFIEKAAIALTNKKTVVKFADNSIFDIIGNEPNISDNAINQVADKITGPVMSELAYIRETLLPIMRDHINHVEDKWENSKTPPSSLGWQIVEDVELPVMEYLLDNDILPKMTRRPITVNLSEFNIGSLDPDNILKLFQHRLTSVNAYMQDILNQYTAEELVLLAKRHLQEDVSTAMNDILYGKIPMEQIVLIFIALSNIKDTSVDQGYSKTTINIANVYYKEIVNTLVMQHEKRLKSIQNKRLVSYFEYNKSAKTCTVYVVSEVYQDFLDNSGTPEALFGWVLLKDTPGVTAHLDAIQEKQDMYVRVSERHFKMEDTLNRNNDHTRLKMIYPLSVKYLFNNLLPDDVLDEVDITVQEAVDSMNELLARPGMDINDTETVIRVFLSEYIFHNTNFGRFTTYMLEYQRLNPDLTPVEIASLAIVPMITDYVLQQVTTDKQ